MTPEEIKEIEQRIEDGMNFINSKKLSSPNQKAEPTTMTPEQPNTLTELIEEAKELVIRLLPGEQFGENDDAERLWEILKELSQTKTTMTKQEVEDLFTVLKHGDEEHQRWLHDKMVEWQSQQGGVSEMRTFARPIQPEDFKEQPNTPELSKEDWNDIANGRDNPRVDKIIDDVAKREQLAYEKRQKDKVEPNTPEQINSSSLSK